MVPPGYQEKFQIQSVVYEAWHEPAQPTSPALLLATACPYFPKPTYQPGGVSPCSFLKDPESVFLPGCSHLLPLGETVCSSSPQKLYLPCSSQCGCRVLWRACVTAAGVALVLWPQGCPVLTPSRPFCNGIGHPVG